MGMAIIHVVGALGASIAFGILIIVLGVWEQQRVQKRRFQDASIALSVPVDVLENDEAHIPGLLRYLSQRYSGELLRNRVSDLCGVLRSAWGWLSNIVQVGIVAGVCWAIYKEGAESAAFMWLMLAASIFFWLASVAFSFTCLLVTGRYPSEAKFGRKSIASAIEQRGASGVKPPPPAWET